MQYEKRGAEKDPQGIGPELQEGWRGLQLRQERGGETTQRGDMA